VANLLLYALVHSRVGQAQGEKTGHCPFESS
jgi:hypothetical protein